MLGGEFEAKGNMDTNEEFLRKVYAQYERCDKYMKNFMRDPVGFVGNREKMIEFHGDLVALKRMWDMFDRKELFVIKYSDSTVGAIVNYINMIDDIKKQCL